MKTSWSPICSGLASKRAVEVALLTLLILSIPRVTAGQESIVAMTEIDQYAPREQRAYLERLEEDVRSILSKQVRVRDKGASLPESGLGFLASQGYRHLIRARLSASQAGVRIYIDVRRTAASSPWLRYPIDLNPTDITEHELQIRGELVGLARTVQILDSSQARQLVLASCIWPETNNPRNSVDVLTQLYGRELQGLLGARQLVVRSLLREEIDYYCQDSSRHYRFRDEFQFVITGKLDQGTLIELYVHKKGLTRGSIEEIELATMNSAETEARKIAQTVAGMMQQ